MLPGAARLPEALPVQFQLLLPIQRNWGETMAESVDLGQEGTPGTNPPEGKQQGLSDAIHRRREDIFHLGFITERSSWG